MNSKSETSNTNMQPNLKRAFDSTICFTFFGSWMDTIVRMETESDRKSQAYMLFKAIAEYSLYGKEPVLDDNDALQMITVIWPMFEREIDNSKSRRKRNFSSDGANEIEAAVIRESIKHPKMPVRQLAVLVGTSKSNANRIQQAHADEIRKAITETNISGDGVSANDKVCFSVDSCTGETGCDVDTYTVNDTMGQGHLGQRKIEDDSMEGIASDIVNEGDLPF